MNNLSESITPDAPALTALAERVEKATDPDRELACEVWLHITGKPFLGFETIPSTHGLPAAYHRFARISPTHTISVMCAPNYTGSLDAALTLIGKDQFWRLGNDGEGPDPADFKATVTSGGGMDLHFHDALAATPALALTAAALRARALAQGGPDAA